jgi:creatinine amidohydrolase
MEIFYERLTPEAFLSSVKRAPIAYLPLGTLEYHGPHLPLGADMLQPLGLYHELALSVGGLVLPPLTLGPDENKVIGGEEFYGMDFEFLTATEAPRRLPGSAYWVDDPAFLHYTEGMVRQLGRAGFRVVVAHGHGPSTDFFRGHSDAWERSYGVKVMTLQGILQEKELGFMVDHAGANETSIMLATNPELVKMEKLPSDPNEWPKGIMGEDPRRNASAEFGRRIIQANLSAMERLLLEEIKALQ